MHPATSLNYDGTFNGLLTCIFISFEEKLSVISINPPDAINIDLFSENIQIITDRMKANRVWKGFKNLASARGQNAVYYAYLSEEPGIELEILKYFQHTFQHKKSIDGDFANPHVLKIAQTAKKVSREKHRMEAFVRFQLTKDTIYFATIEPDFNVLPLIKKHFSTRYSDQEWIIYDLKRKFGLYYNLTTTNIINIDFAKNSGSSEENDYFFDSHEQDFQKLWKNYFKATTIKSRINTRLHQQHVPKRYWKYLIEKNPLHN
ncbi:TIGR03915 family putative DNA repair protein [Salegentibacter salegens]|uniref:Probable DNA metabolism protein n=1 Tax=Salegentibacter salegens TaxID=143223 RepID=A0A1M7IG90_9FLAO|nr:TIGR03915 family putative DNA repair protein [Salegentibacter salegens]PRX43749.1 putative DNA metabolism protein [Salegentibacter salegens]SHM39856.1 probable DNA metabolism protein [Salegentibacter salegens]